MQTVVIAGDDDISVRAGREEEFDLLANDVSTTGSTLTITEINGQPVSVGDTVTLTTGEQITLTDTGMVLADTDGDLGTNTFTYTVEDEDGNADVGLVNLTTTVPCFTTDTLIETSQGPVPVQQLRPGDLVMTVDHGPQPLRWIGSRRLERAELSANPHLKPVRIAINALAPGRPNHDLMVSPQHRVMLSSKIAHRMFGCAEVLVAAKKLLTHEGVSVVENTPDGVEYVHILFEDHQVVYSNGMPTESLLVGPEVSKALPPDAIAEIREIFPRFKVAECECTPARRLVRKARKIDQLVLRHLKNARSLFENVPIQDL